jgi:hypothetical protein
VFELIEREACSRISNYLPGITRVEHGRERYRAFNAGRREACDSRGRHAVHLRDCQHRRPPEPACRRHRAPGRALLAEVPRSGSRLARAELRLKVYFRHADDRHVVQERLLATGFAPASCRRKSAGRSSISRSRRMHPGEAAYE